MHQRVHGRVEEGGTPLLLGAHSRANQPRPLPYQRLVQILHVKRRIFIERMTSDRKLEASREVSKSRIYGTYTT